MSRESGTIARMPRCFTSECDRDSEKGRRGYCDRCYQAIRRRIRANKISEEELVARGKWQLSRIDKFIFAK